MLFKDMSSLFNVVNTTNIVIIFLVYIGVFLPDSLNFIHFSKVDVFSEPICQF